MIDANGKKTIIVADDEKTIAEALSDMLSPYYNILCATTGLDVLILMSQGNYHGLIIDVTFEHGMNGLEVVDRIRVRNKDIKILVFSATDYSDSIRQRALSLGASFYEKPLTLETIRRVMG